MFGLNNNSVDENIKNPPADVPYPIVNALFSKNHEVTISSLSITMLDLINQDQIKCDIEFDESYCVGDKLTSDDLEVMKKITLRIANKGELKTSETVAINLVKNINKNKKFNLKSMAKQTNVSAIANRFEKDYLDYAEALKNENNYDTKNYNDILKNGKLANDVKNDWKDFHNYLKSADLSDKYPPKSADENSSQIIYAACFGIEKEALKFRENNSPLTNFIDKDGYKLLNIIFSNALSNVSQKRRGNGIFYGVNDKYTIPGGG